MKKVFSLFLVCVCLVLSGCVLKDAAILYSERTEKDGFEIAVNKTGKTCFVGEYVCDEYTEDKEITVPDECGGIPVEQLGGFYGRGVAMPFHISLEELYVNISRDDHRVVGAETRFTENNNDYIVFGINKEMLSDIYDLLPEGIDNFRKKFPMPDSVFIQAHPMREGMQNVDTTLLDGMEVFNMHPNHNSKVGLASVYANENNIPIIIAGSDFHNPNKNFEGVSALRGTYLPEDSFELAKLLKTNDYLLEIGRNNIIIP